MTGWKTKTKHRHTNGRKTKNKHTDGRKTKSFRKSEGKHKSESSSADAGAFGEIDSVGAIIAVAGAGVVVLFGAVGVAIHVSRYTPKRRGVPGRGLRINTSQGPVVQDSTSRQDNMSWQDMETRQDTMSWQDMETSGHLSTV